ncbi:aminotransferase class V-fold PLP-dependent enzyme [Hydrogenoanaerobacterium sp.]|uniref:aminotransferase class V-fold PLP-dependent enzyme n=1 Tax=Hydrogenoanaerobacterium sp. TaxID=2953763 RepID=UPI0028A1FF9D|nr:aminotransferase class V-fold PLP-dependent enzyme [Hydrogenoanaerobacterium sp.]
MSNSRKVYLDNASTTFPKAPGVAQRVSEFIEQIGCNVGRGEYEDAYSAAEVVLDTRERLCALFGLDEPRNVIFTQNVTAALNMVLKGFFKEGDHLLVSAMEHNAVMRPVTQLLDDGVTFDRIPCSRDGELLFDEMEPLLRPSTKAIVMTHASNICGTLLPIEQVGKFCRQHGLWLIVDCAQTGGVYPINMKSMQIDALCFTGHKGLLAPQGIGGFLITDAFAKELTPLLSGGTGSFSNLETLPTLLPDRFEAGTPNLPGIYGLNTSLQYLESYGIERIQAEEQALTQRMSNGLAGINDLRVVGVTDVTKKSAIVSLDFLGRDNAEVAYRLDSEYGIMARCGLHCAPNAHKTLGTYPQGTVRFSFSHFNTAAQIDYAVECIHKILSD